jgi:hypothetical protein
MSSSFPVEAEMLYLGDVKINRSRISIFGFLADKSSWDPSEARGIAQKPPSMVVILSLT